MGRSASHRPSLRDLAALAAYKPGGDSTLCVPYRNVLIGLVVFVLVTFIMAVVMLAQRDATDKQSSTLYNGLFDVPLNGKKKPEEPLTNDQKAEELKTRLTGVVKDPVTGRRALKGRLSTDNLREGERHMYWTDERFASALADAELPTPAPGKPGRTGRAGQNATELSTFEAINSNLASYAYEIKYDGGGNITSVIYTVDAGIITKTFDYTVGGSVDTITLSGQTPGNVTVSKHFVYDGDGNVTDITYA